MGQGYGQNIGPYCGPKCTVQVGIGSDVTFTVQLFQNNAPLDLTSMTAISASFPAPNAGSVVETYSNGNISIVGAPGAGQIQITAPGKDTLLMQPNPVPQQFQDLQIVVTLSGRAQVDHLTISGSIVVGATYSVTLNSQLFSYVANTGDTDLIVFNAIAALISAAPQPFPISVAVSGSPGSALITLTSTIPALGFSDVVSSNITKTAFTANGGTRALFILQSILNISQEPFPLV